MGEDKAETRGVMDGMRWGDEPEARDVRLADPLPVRSSSPSLRILNTGRPVVLIQHPASAFHACTK